ncbi:MAG: extracellular solute-binding protein [Chloroflexi bacterium]|nr:extracellular solute-binding protein [Chloroflexota bacterium]
MSDLTERRLSRRRVLQLSLAAAGAAALASCSAPTAPPAATQAPAKPGGLGGALAVWNVTSFSETADKAIGEVFKEWGAKNNVNVDYQLISSTGSEYKNRVTAALEAKTPPEIFFVLSGEAQYYRSQDTLQDISDVITSVKDLEGGMFEAALVSIGHQGKYYAVPFTVNPWVLHAREDLLKAAGVQYPKTWDEMIGMSDKVSKPPQIYTFAMTLGDDNDTSYNFLPLAWTHGGALQNEQGALTFKSPGMVEAIRTVKQMWDKKLIPPGAVTWDSSGNNTAYQKGQAVFAYNPNSIYAYLEAEAKKPTASQQDKDMFANTGMYGMPAGPKGSFDEIDVRGFAAFKGAKNPAAAKEALKYLVQPAGYAKVIETGLNRWAPVYKNMMDRPQWQAPAYKNYKHLMEVGKTLAHAGPPNAAFEEVITTWIIPRMLQDVVSGSKDAEKAMNEAYDKMVEVYKKWKQPIA